MRSKEAILNDLKNHTEELDHQHYELASVAMIETEIQIDIRDILHDLLQNIGSNIIDLARES